MNEEKIHFEIVPYSRMENLHRNTHNRIRKEASHKTILSMYEKGNIHKCISSTQIIHDNAPEYINGLVVFMGGWYCKPLKKYLINLGYEVYPCGNNFDLWINLYKYDFS